MNQYQTDLFNNLEALIKDSDVFYRQEFELEGSYYWIYNYRLASYSNFLLPGALEARGIMFQIGFHVDTGNPMPLRLAALPMEKFWNLNENPMTMNLDLSQVVDVESKADGSLMSTYHDNGRLRLKSKGSLFSEQALAAMEWLETKENALLHHALECYTVNHGCTVNLEWCAPQHRIVIGYMKPELKVLNIRSRFDGSYIPYEQVQTIYFIETYECSLRDWWVDRPKVDNIPDFIEKVPEMEGIEGYIYRFANGQRVKHKTKWYLALHHTKDSINSPRRLYEAVLSEAADDLKALFHDDPLAIKQIADMEAFVEEKYNRLVSRTTKYYEANKQLGRKDYAVLGQLCLDRHEFGLAMRLFLNQEVNFKDYMLAKWKEFGVKDDPEPVVDTTV